MRFRFLFFMFGILAFMLGACGNQEEATFTPADDQLTFLFFYTDG